MRLIPPKQGRWGLGLLSPLGTEMASQNVGREHKSPFARLVWSEIDGFHWFRLDLFAFTREPQLFFPRRSPVANFTPSVYMPRKLGTYLFFPTKAP